LIDKARYPASVAALWDGAQDPRVRVNTNYIYSWRIWCQSDLRKSG